MSTTTAGTTTKPTGTTTKPSTGNQTTLKQQGCGLANCCQHQESCSYEDKIRLRAYQLWEEAGHPEGDGTQFWYTAEQELTHADVTLEQIADET